MNNKINIFLQAMLAGILIGIGVIINTTLTIPVLGAMLFSFGLLTIIELKLPLYTGKIGYAFNGQKDLLTIFLGNVAGMIVCIEFQMCGNLDSIQRLTSVAEIKFSKSAFEMFFCGIMCGILIHFAVRTRQFYTTIMAIMIFILIGGEHCIADVPYLIANMSLDSLFKFICVVLGNSLGAIAIEEMLRANNG